MAMTETRMASLKAYCRLDALTADEEVLLKAMYDGAVSYMEDAGIAAPEEGTSRRGKYDLCVNAIVLDSWDNRGTQAAGYTITENPAFRRTLNQLKLTEPVSNSDAGSGAL